MFTFLFALLGISLFINIAMFLVAYYRQTDKLTDISYAASFIILVAASFVAAPQKTADKLTIAMMSALWAIRLGTYLLIRISTMGRDKRFDDIRHNFVAFGRFWLGQALAVWVILIPTILAMDSKLVSSSLWITVGTLIWVIGFAIEGTADIQKFRFITDPNNKGRWIDNGLWRLSRHPNYFGEILVWVGVYVASMTLLSTRAAIIALVSPLFIAGLLLFVSGVPPLEKSANKKWGDDPKYQAYKKRTRLLIPLPK